MHVVEDGEVLFDKRDTELFWGTSREAICQAKLETRKQKHVDGWNFLGHHPYPPKERESKTVMGVQFVSSSTIRYHLLYFCEIFSKTSQEFN